MKNEGFVLGDKVSYGHRNESDFDGQKRAFYSHFIWIIIYIYIYITL